MLVLSFFWGQYFCNKIFIKNIMNYSTNTIFNSTIAAYAVSAACELEFLDELQHNGTINITNICDNRNLHKPSIISIFDALCCFDICIATENPGIFKQGSLFSDIYRNKGFFLWLVRGYGTIMQNLASVVKNENRTGNFIQRNGEYVAIASHQQGSRMVDPYFDSILNESSFSKVVDLGCGSAERLINLAKKFPSVRGIGIDINPEAVKVAQKAILVAGVESQIKVIQADMRKLEQQTDFIDVDTLLCFFSGHDLWPWENCLHIMRNFHTAFPNVKRFLLCDTNRSGTVPSSDIPTFTLGFELIHSFMGQYIPSITEWMALFAESGWKCVQRQDIEVSFSTIFDLRPE